MNKKELGQIKRHTSPTKSTSSKIYGCYATPSSDVISSFTVLKSDMNEDDLKQYFDIFRAVLSPQFGEKSHNIEFSTSETRNAPHQLLMELDNCHLEDEEVRRKLYDRIMHSIDMESNYLILLDYEVMDLPPQGGEEESEEVFRYMVCAICEVTLAKTFLSYANKTKDFHIATAGFSANKPFAGFMFPAFNDCHRDIYGGLFYASKMDVNQQNLISAIFGKESPTTQAQQQRLLADVISSSLGDDCTISLVDEMRRKIEEGEESAKLSDESDGQYVLDKNEITQILSDTGIDAEKINAFQDAYDENFGADAELPAAAVIDTKRVKLEADSFSLTTDVVTMNGIPITGADVQN